MSIPSSETLTFLFTDIEGSTSLWDLIPEAMTAALQRHGEIVAAHVAGGDGTLVKARGEGDSTFSVFPNAAKAVIAAAEIQRALLTETWPDEAAIRVRAALHTGSAFAMGTDFNSTAVNRCARLRSLGHGQQTLLSETTHALAQDDLPDDFAFHDLGTHTLKGLTRPERVYQLLCPPLPSEFPPLLSSERASTNLPIELTSFVGRVEEMREVQGRLRQTRMLTLSGPVGCGKTRLARRVAASLQDEFQDGVWLVSLAELGVEASLPDAVAAALHLRPAPMRDSWDALAEYLADKQLLLLLDNCEHVREQAASLAADLLQAAPGLRILATSQLPLEIAAETVWPLASLHLPSFPPLPSLSELSSLDSVQLFVERAASKSPGFALNARNAPIIARICQRLDGIPLAIELAAACTQTLGLAQIEKRLDRRFPMMVSADGTLPARHRTLRAAFDWSYGLLSPGERSLLRQLSVFRGYWSLEAAEEICTVPDSDEVEVFTLQAALINRSLVMKVEENDVARFRLQESVRAYAQEKLGEEREPQTVWARHYRFFGALAARGASVLEGVLEADWLDTMEAEHENLLAALDYVASDTALAQESLNLANNLYPFWSLRGYLSEGRRAFARVLTQSETLGTIQERARALAGAGALAWSQGDYPAALSLFEECLAMRRELGDTQRIADVLSNMGLVRVDQGEYEAAQALFEESLAISRQNHDSQGIASTLVNLAWLACDRGDIEAASKMFEESLTLERSRKDSAGIAESLNGLGDVALRENDYGQARTLKEESLKIRHQIGDMIGMAETWEGLAAIAVDVGLNVPAAILLGAAACLQTEIEAPVQPRRRQRVDLLTDTLHTKLTPDSYQNAWTQGHDMSPEQVVTYVLEEMPRPVSPQPPSFDVR